MAASKLDFAGEQSGGKQPGSRSQKLELGKSHGAVAGTRAIAVARPPGGKILFTRRVITLGQAIVAMYAKAGFA